MEKQTMIVAGGGVLFAVLFSVAIANSMANKKVARVMGQAGEATATSVAEASDALSARLDELEASLGDRAASASAQMEERLAALEADFSARMEALSDSAAAQASDFEAMISDLVAASGAAAMAQATMGAQMETAAPRRVGETAVLADGALRVFVSKIDLEDGAVRLSVNGELVSLDVGDTAPVSVGDAQCMVGLVALNAAGATVGSDCGAGGAAATAGTKEPPAPTEGHAPGTVASLADGAIRVFVSGLAADGSAARVAVNGVDTQTVASGETIEVAAGDKTCSLTITGVGNGVVALEGSCN